MTKPFTDVRKIEEFESTAQKTQGKAPSSQVTFANVEPSQVEPARKRKSTIASRTIENTERKEMGLDQSLSEQGEAAKKPYKPLFQLKKSNSTRPARKAIGYDPDMGDILGELVASEIAYVMMNGTTPDQFKDVDVPEHSPHVFAVTDTPPNHLRIASRYMNHSKELNGKFDGMVLDDVMTKQVGKAVDPKYKHPVFVNGDDMMGIPNALPIGRPIKINVGKGENAKEIDVVVNKTQLFEGIAASFLLGDADINPGNFWGSYNKTPNKDGQYELRVGRIDWGHAFNDMIKNYGHFSEHTPNFGKGRGAILDALNREDLNGAKTTTFRRDYRGIIPDVAFADALRDMADVADTKQQEGLAFAKANIAEILDDKEPGSEARKAEDRKGLVTLNERMGTPLRGNDRADDKLLDKTFENMGSVLSKNTQDMCSVADLIEVQSIVEKAIKGQGKTSIGELGEEEKRKIEDIYGKKTGYLINGSDSKNEWVKTDDDKKPFKGTLEQYFDHRLKQHEQQLDKRHALEEKANKSANYQPHEFDGEQFLKTTLKSAAVGGGVGAVVGGIAGAVVGSVFMPGFGTVFGAVAGAAVGGAAGAVAGAVGGAVALAIKEGYHKVKDFLHERQEKKLQQKLERQPELEKPKERNKEQGQDREQEQNKEQNREKRPITPELGQQAKSLSSSLVSLNTSTQSDRPVKPTKVQGDESQSRGG